MIDIPIVIACVILLLILLMLGVPVAGVLIIVGVTGITYLQGFHIAMMTLKHIPYMFAASWTMSSVVMYLIMGYFAFEMGLAGKIYNFVRLALGNVPGALSVSTSLACAGFGAVCGSSTATTAAFSKLSVPEMLRDNYDKGLASGSIAASGTMGSLMPPSILMIIYATLAEISVGKCFIAGILPCILSATIYGAMVMVRVKINPRLAPAPPRVKVTPRILLKSLLGLWDVFLLIFIIFGGIYSGFVTATEAGALAAFAALAIGLFTRRLNWQKIKVSILEGVKITGVILIIAVGANIVVRFLAFAGVHEYVQVAFTGFPLMGFIGMMFVVYVLLGMFLDPIGMMLLTIPVLVPIFSVVGISPVLFCILVIKAMELACITPPIGLTVYVVKGVVGQEIPTETIFKGIAWFTVMDVITFWILAFFPAISMVLPNLVFGE